MVICEFAGKLSNSSDSSQNDDSSLSSADGNGSEHTLREFSKVRITRQCVACMRQELKCLKTDNNKMNVEGGTLAKEHNDEVI